MARRNLSHKNFSEYATGELDYVISKQVEEKKEYIPTVTAAEAMQEERLLEYKSSRDVTRVLFISRNTDLLNPTQQTLDGYLNISEVFDEVHILILRQGIEPKQPIFRPEKNVFMYTVATRFWWQMPIAGIDMIKAQLVFADGFRPDLIVARDPFESALVAWWASRKFGRPMQLHVLINFFHPSFVELATPNRWRKFIAYFTIPKFYSIRAATDRILLRLQEKTDIHDLMRLPQLNPYEAVAKVEQKLDLKEKYPQYVFTILFIGSLKDPTAALQAIDAARYMLRNDKVSMMILGDGSGRADCERRAKTLGLEKQIIIEPRPIDYVQYLKAADLLVVTNTDVESEELVLMAAGAKIPMVMARTEKRDDVFSHLESAYMCAQDDAQAQSDGVHELMNNYELRHQVSEQAFATISSSFHQDPNMYRDNYRTSIESALFAEEVAKELEEQEEQKAAEKKATEQKAKEDTKNSESEVEA